MTSGDYLAIAILIVFALLGLTGRLRWLVRTLVGLAVGCVVLLVVSQLEALPAAGTVARLVNDGTVAPAISGCADQIAQNIGIKPNATEQADSEIYENSGGDDQADNSEGSLADAIISGDDTE